MATLGIVVTHFLRLLYILEFDILMSDVVYAHTPRYYAKSVQED